MQAVLTDDEIVAVCAAVGLPWPLPLTTVDLSDAGISWAGLRGLRSLAVRGLVARIEDRKVISSDVAELVAAAAGAKQIVMAYVSPVDTAGWAGAAVVGLVMEDGLLLDAIAANGMHALGHVDASEARTRLKDFAHQKYAGLREDGGPRWCVLVSDNQQAQLLRVLPGKVERGRLVEGTGGSAEFVPDGLGVLEFDAVDQLFQTL